MDQKIPARLNIVTLGVHDLAVMRSFYEALGWPSNPVGDKFVSFDLGGAMLALYPLEELAEEARMTCETKEERFARERFAGFTCAINVESEEMVDAAIEAVREAGGRILAEPVTREWGGRSGYFADPEDNAWEIAWAPGTTFDERGALIF